MTKPPSYLADYACLTAAKPYPISSVHSYDKLSTDYKAYALQLESNYEPTYFHQAVKHPEG